MPLRLRSSLNKDKGPCPVRRKRPVGSQRRRTLPWLNPSALAAHEAGSPRALSVKCAGPLTSSKTSCLLFPGSIVIFLREREPADSMNQPLPRERVAAPARNIHLQKQFIPLSGALGKCPRRVPSEARGAGAGEGVGTTAPHPHPAPHAPLSSAPARPEPPGWPMRLRRPGPRGGSLRRRLPRRGRGAQGPGGGGDKCQGRRPGARLRRPGAAPSARRWYSPLGAPPPATLPARCRRCRRRDHRLLAAPPHPPPPLPAPGQPQSPELLRPRFGPRRRQQTSFSGLPAPPPGPKLCSQSQGAPL